MMKQALWVIFNMDAIIFYTSLFLWLGTLTLLGCFVYAHRMLTRRCNCR